MVHRWKHYISHIRPRVGVMTDMAALNVRYSNAPLLTSPSYMGVISRHYLHGTLSRLCLGTHLSALRRIYLFFGDVKYCNSPLGSEPQFKSLITEACDVMFVGFVNDRSGQELLACTQLMSKHFEK
jgi:hypothetical protein